MRSPVANDTFFRLTDWYDEGDMKSSKIESVVILHREWSPDDPWDLFYAAILHGERGKYVQAEEAMDRWIELQQDESVFSNYRYHRIGYSL